METTKVYKKEENGNIEFFIHFLETDVILSINDSRIINVMSIPNDAEIHMWGGDVTGAINNARLNGKSRFYIDATRLLEDYSDLRGLYMPE